MPSVPGDLFESIVFKLSRHSAACQGTLALFSFNIVYVAVITFGKENIIEGVSPATVGFGSIKFLIEALRFI